MLSILPNWHPIFVHFTVALLTVAAIMHALSHFMPQGSLRNQLAMVGRWNLWIGIAFTLLTVAAGWYAYNTVTHDTPSHVAMTDHRNWAMGTFVVFMGIAAWEYYLHRHGQGKGWLFTLLLVLAASLMLSTAWHGGELVYRYGLGVMSMPKPDGAAGHAHDGDDMEHGNGDMDKGDGEEHSAMPHEENIRPAPAASPHSDAAPHKH